CINCIRIIKSSLKSLLNILNELQIIRAYLKYQKEVKSSQTSLNFYIKYFFEHHYDLNKDKAPKEKEKLYRDDPIESYSIGKYNLFNILIYKIPNEFEKFYETKISFSSKLEEDYYSKIIFDITKNLEFVNIDKIMSLEELIKIYKNKANQYINLKYNLTEDKTKKLALLAAIQKLNIQKLFPFLIDDRVEEIFLDAPYDKLYLDHQKFGRCRTRIVFNPQEIERIKTLVRLYSSKRIDYANPSIKLVLNNKYFYCRFAIDTEPINLNAFSLDIRKLNKNIFTIQDLLKNRTLSPLIAAYLYFNIIRGFNITVTGETNTGKTTLINALDLLIPKGFRKIYVESITESLNQSKFERHQLKYKVDSSEDSIKQKFSKQNQINKLLHRTPDIIYLGEILTRSEAKAMFHCLAAGLRGFQTIHSNGLDSFINRVLFHFKIDKICLKDLDLIILMKKIHQKRKLISISEIIDDDSSKDTYRRIFEYNPESNSWDLSTDLFNTHSVKKIRKTEPIDTKKFNSYIQIYKEIFELLLNIPPLPLKELFNFFDKIAFLSYISLEKLEDFWNSWRRARSLNY
ncbi:MAG: ATPase, T2SS/T4P/T4SS family, partial [Candidatus Thorarchaeota archaeon]